MKIKKIKAKSIITKSNLPEADFVINPYIGCMHGCKYCYARFIKRFTGHRESWGEFVDVKTNSEDLIPDKLDKYKGKIIVIGSVTDPYQKQEENFEITRKILNKIKNIDAEINILTKSDLILRDIAILKEFKNLKVAISLASLDENIIKNFENNSISPKRRIKATKNISENNIYTILFISPILPYLTNWREIIDESKKWVDEYWFENLNLYPSIKEEMLKVVGDKYPILLEKFKEVYIDKISYWNKEEANIKKYCNDNNLKFKIYFHHNNN